MGDVSRILPADAQAVDGYRLSCSPRRIGLFASRTPGTSACQGKIEMSPPVAR